MPDIAALFANTIFRIVIGVLALVGVIGFGIIVSPHAAMNLLAKDVFDVFASYGFTVIPLFILMGQIAFNAGIAKRLYNASYKFVGHIPGGMAMATVAGATADGAVATSSLPESWRWFVPSTVSLTLRASDGSKYDLRNMQPTIGVTISWLCECSNEAPAAAPTFLKIMP